MPPLVARNTATGTLLDVHDPVTPVSDQEIFRKLYPGLRRFAVACADRDIDPDDLIQSALVRCLARTALADLDNPGAYLRSAVMRQASDERRRFLRRRTALARLRLADDTSDSYPSDVDFLDELATFDRTVLYLIHVEGWRSEDVADAFGTTATAVRARASRARKALRQLLGELEIDDA